MNAARKIVESLIQEAQGDLRFDVDARVEVWVTADDIEDDRRARQIRNGANGVTPEKISALKDLALTIAGEKVRGLSQNGVEVTADLALSDLNVDRIDWNTLAMSDADRQAAEQQEQDEFDRQFPG